MLKTTIFMLIFLFISVQAIGKGSRVIIKTLKNKNDHGSYILNYPQLKPDVEIINDQLNKNVINSYLCDKDSSIKNRMSSETKIKTYLLDENFFSYQVNYQIYCGGAYPDSGISYINYDIKKKQFIDSNNQFKNIQSVNYYLSQRFRNKIPHDIDKSCLHLYNNEQLKSSYYEWLLIKGGFKARLSFAHAARACEYTVKFNCHELKKLLIPNQQFYKHCLK